MYFYILGNFIFTGQQIGEKRKNHANNYAFEYNTDFERIRSLFLPIFPLSLLLLPPQKIPPKIREALVKEVMSSGSVFESSRSAVPVRNAGGATHYTEIETAADRDTRAILEKNVRLNE